MQPLRGYTFDKCLPLADDALSEFLETTFLQARERILASVFLVDPRPASDRDLRVRCLLQAMAEAAYRGVDARLIVPWSSTPEISIANRATVVYARSLELPVQLTSVRGNEGSHSKYVVIDNDCVIVGSHNWTYRAFAFDTEDSLCIWSPDLAAEIADLFNEAWEVEYAD